MTKMKAKKLKSTFKKLKMMEKKKVTKLLKKNDANKSSVILRNLPFSASEIEVEGFLKQFGQVQYVKLSRRRNGKLSGEGFVKYHSVESAENAVKCGSGSVLMGRKIEVNRVPCESSIFDQNTEIIGEKLNIKLAVDSIDELKTEIEDDNEANGNQNKVENNNQLVLQNLDTKARRGKIIVRNIPFKVTDEKFRKHFEPFGEITEIKLLRKSDGKLVGCGFVQFKTKQNAIRAILERSGKEFLGRPIICDWAIPKDKYLKQVEDEIIEEDVTEVKVKEEPLSDSELENEKSNSSRNKRKIIEKYSIDDDDDDDDDDGDDSDDNEESEFKIEKDIHKKKFKCERDGDEGSDDDEFEGGDLSDSKFGIDKKRVKDLPSEKKPKFISNDVTEGCTVFVKNVPFYATGKELEMCMKQFGSLHYAVICIDEITEHSKGTGFVKFKKKEAADKCLQASGEITIGDKPLEVVPALPRNEIKSLRERKKEKLVKDNRHLYLVKEGVILAGSYAAKGVSVADMEKRLKIEQWKTQILRNLNMFVSNTRLVVYNLPPSWTDQDVRRLFLQHAGKGAILKEARIMRNMRDVDANGVGKSKEYAFVHFTEQEHALRALRSINNNPEIFTPAKRPIVVFSIENKAIHKIKQKRMQKSRETNMKKINKSNETEKTLHKKEKKFSKKNSQNQERQIQKPNVEANEEINKYTGIIAKPGNKKLRSRFNLKTQASVHWDNVKKDKHRLKMKRKSKLGKEKKSEVMPKAKKRTAEGNDSFSKLVDRYKNKLSSFENQKRWYE